MKLKPLYFAGLLIGAMVKSYAADTSFPYNEDSVMLSGKVVLQTFYGPPNYGENPKTDSRETQAILELDQILCTVTTMDRPEVTQQVVTLVPLGNFSLVPYAGKHVRVKGSLFHAITGHHHTPVLIELRQPPEIKE